MICKCEICGKEFQRKPSQVKKAKHCYCSQKCHYEGKKEYFSGKNNHQYGLKGSKNPSWKSDRRESHYGYWMVRVLDHPFHADQDFVFEHRLIAEKFLLNDENSIEINGKRYLSPEYAVHHKNFDRMDNRVENLVVMTKQEHQSMHCKLNMQDRQSEDGRFAKGKRRFKRATESASMPQEIDDNVYLMSADISEDMLIRAGEIRLIDTGIVPVPDKGEMFTVFSIGKIANPDVPLRKRCVRASVSQRNGTVRTLIENDTQSDIVIKPNDMILMGTFTNVPKIEFEITGGRKW